MPFVHSIQSKKTVEFNAETLNDIMNEFEMFLRGAGFHFNGHLDIVEEEEFVEEDDFSHSSKEWDAVVQSMMNPPKFRASEEKCPVCSIPKNRMEGNNCWDTKCPLPESAVNAN
jgi:hypothetical protein